MAIGTPTDIGPVVEDVSQGATTTFTVGATGAAIGDELTAAISVRSGDTLAPAITDSKGNTGWAIVEHRTSTSVSHQFLIARCRVATALLQNDTIVCTWNLSADPGVDSAVMEVVKTSGLDASPLDGTQHTGAGGDSSAIDSGDITPSAGNRIVFGGVGNRDLGMPTPDGDFTALTGGQADPGTNSQASTLTWGYISQAWDGSTVVAYESATVEFRWAAAIMSLKEAAAGVTVVVPNPGILTLSTNAPAVEAGASVEATAASTLVLTAQAPEIVSGTKITVPAPNEIAIQMLAPDVSAAVPPAPDSSKTGVSLGAGVTFLESVRDGRMRVGRDGVMDDTE